MNTIRTYEQFAIAWADGSRWTGYESAAEAQATVDFAAGRGGRVGTVERTTFDVELSPALRRIARPGIAERIAERPAVG